MAHVTRSSSHVAATLVSDATHRRSSHPGAGTARKNDHRPVSVLEEPDAAEPTWLKELAGLVAEARRHGLPGEDLTIVRELMRAESTTTVAAVAT